MTIFCSICRDFFENNTKTSALRCGHLFHAVCLDMWLKCNSTCPRCRRQSKGKPITVKFCLLQRTTVVRDEEYEKANYVWSVKNKELENLRVLYAKMKARVDILEKENKDAESTLKKFERERRLLDLYMMPEFKNAELLIEQKKENSEMMRKLDLVDKFESILHGEAEIFRAMMETKFNFDSLKELYLLLQCLQYKVQMEQERYEKDILELKKVFDAHKEALEKKVLKTVKKDHFHEQTGFTSIGTQTLGI